MILERQADINMLFDRLHGKDLKTAQSILGSKGVMIGEGLYSQVFKSEGNVVLKINEGDTGFSNFFDITQKHNHPFHPKIFKYMSWEQDGGYNINLYAMEYVEIDADKNRDYVWDKLGSRSRMTMTPNDLVDIFKNYREPEEVIEKFTHENELGVDAYDFITLFKDWFFTVKDDIDRDNVIDLHNNNWGFDSRGDIKFIDPLAKYSSLF